MAAEGFGDLGAGADDELALDNFLDEFLREQNLGPGDIEEFKLSEMFEELVKELNCNPDPSSISRTMGNNNTTPATVPEGVSSPQPQPSTSKQTREEGLNKRRNSRNSSGCHQSPPPEGPSARSRPPKEKKTGRTQPVNSMTEQTTSPKLDKELQLQLVDLSRMKSVFPGGVPTQIITSLKMIKKIADLEQELKETLPSEPRRNKKPDVRLQRKHEPQTQSYSIPKASTKAKSTLVTSTPVKAKAVSKEVSECETQSHKVKRKPSRGRKPAKKETESEESDEEDKERFEAPEPEPTATSNSPEPLAEEPESSKNLASDDTGGSDIAEHEDFTSAINEESPVEKDTHVESDSDEIQEIVADTDTENDNQAVKMDEVKATTEPEQCKDKIEATTIKEIINDAIITEPHPETEDAQKSDLEPSPEPDELTLTQEPSIAEASTVTAPLTKAAEDDHETQAAQVCTETANVNVADENDLDQPAAGDIVNETGPGDKGPSPSPPSDKGGDIGEPPQPDTDTGRNEMDASTSKDDKSEIDEQDKEMLSVPQDQDDAGSFNPFDDDNYDSQMSSSPDVPKSTRFRRSPSPNKSSKKKKIIESSSDAETTPERKRSSDEEQMRAPLERKRDRGDSQPRKFAKLEDERRRKLSEKKNKKDPDKRKGSETFDEVYKEKSLAGSFRIPKRTTQKRTKVVSGTPLALEQVPKENLQFERCRKNADDKDTDFDRDNFQRRNNRGGGGGGRMRQDSGFKEGYRPKWLTANDENRMVLLAPEAEIKQKEGNEDEPTPAHANIPFDDDHEDEPPVMDPPPPAPAPPQPEPFWGSDGEESGGGATPSEPSEKDEFEVTEMDDRNAISKPEPSNPVQVPAEEIAEEEEDEEPDQELDPEVPIEELVPNPFTKGVVIEMMNKEKQKKSCELPDMDSKDYSIAEGIVLKLAWWFSKSDFAPRERFHRYYDTDSELSDTEADENLGDDTLLPVSDDEEEFGRDRVVRVSTDEFLDAGRALLTAKYRTGPGDTFTNIFDIRGRPEQALKKHNYQAYCTLCSTLVVGNTGLAAHVQTEKHRTKMENLGDTDPKSSEDERKAKAGALKVAGSKDKEKENGGAAEPQKIGDKRPSEEKKKEESSGKERKERDSESDDKDREEHNRKRIADDRERRKARERERSRHRSPSKKSKEEDAEVGVTSTGLSLKIPSSAMPNRKRRSRTKSRSRSPRHDRKRVRSPLRVRRSHSRERGHSRSRTPVQRIARSPARLRELKDKDRRRSSSVERRMEKFVAENNRRRSPSRSRSRKRSRLSRSRSRSPSNNTLNRKRDNRAFNQKLTLTAMGLWTDKMEKEWKLVELEEAVYNEEFLGRKKGMKDRPESYPTYAEEWEKFWERRSLELENEGVNPDDHDFVPEWKKYWDAKMKDLLENEFHEKLAEIRVNHGMDFNSLLKIEKDYQNKESSVKAPPPVPAPVPPPVRPPSVNLEPTFQLKSFLPPIVSTGSLTDDMGGKPMSISSEGGVSNNSIVEMPPQAQTTNIPAAPPVTVTPNEFLTQWKNMTSVPSSSTTQAPTNGNRLLSSSSLAVDAKSVTSSSIASIDLAGFDLVEVLRLLSTMEDQLSFLASQTKEYFKRAEEYELKKHNKSLELMDEKDFVTLLIQIRDRFVPLRRSPLQSEEALRRLQTSLDGINAILETPQCKKHQIASTSQISPPRREEPEIEIIEVVEEPSSSSQRRTNQPQPDSSEPRRKLSQSQKTKISWMLTHYLIGNGYQDLTDAKLRGLVKNVMGPPGRSRAAQGSTPTSSGTRTFAGRRFVSPDSSTLSHNQQRSASTAPTSFARPRNPIAEPWPSPSNTPQISKTYNIVTTKSMGSAFPPLPDFSTVPSGGVVSRGRDREDRTRRDHVGFNFGSGEVSSSDSGRLSPFTRRGENSSNPFRDKAVEKTESEHNLINERRVSISVIDDVYVKGQKGGRSRHEEIKVGQLVTTGTSGGRRSSRDSARSDKKSQIKQEDTEIEIVDNAERDRLQSLPPGIRQMILKEREMKTPEVTRLVIIPSSDDDDDGRLRWRRRRHKRSKKSKRKDYDSASSGLSSDYEHKYRQKEREKRKRRRRRHRDENSWKIARPASPTIFEVDRKEKHFQDVNYYYKGRRLGSPLSSANSRVYMPVTDISYSPRPLWDELSEISSFGDGVIDRGKQENEHAVASVRSEVKRVSPPVVDNKVKVDSVSKAFWTMKDKDDRSLSSISSAELRPPPAVVPAVEVVNPKKISRQYRASIEIEKEDGEIGSTDDEDK